MELKGARQKMLYKGLKAAGAEGLHRDVVVRMLGGRAHVMYSAVLALRRKGVEIERKGENYVLTGEAAEAANSTDKPQHPVPATTQAEPTPSTAMSDRQLLRKLEKLSPSDKADALDMLKKSIFYRKSAEALIEANEITRNIEESSL